jgi:RNA polymerase sigma-70 factor (ECF subfamily)
VGNEDMAKDICQITFIRTFKQLKRLKDPEKFSAWIYRIALNLCRDEFKRRKSHRLTYLEDILTLDEESNYKKQLPDKSSETPDNWINQRQIGELLNHAMQALPEKQRVVIIMKQYQGLKFHEIADILKEPINTIKSRLYYGLRSLRKILEESKLTKEVLLNEM